MKPGFAVAYLEFSVERVSADWRDYFLMRRWMPGEWRREHFSRTQEVA